MLNIKFCKFKIWHIMTCVDLLYAQWNSGRLASQSKGKVCSWIYMMAILENCTNMIVCKKDRKVIGMAGFHNYRQRKTIHQIVYSLIRKILLYSPNIKYKNKIIDYYRSYEYLPEKMAAKFDGEMDILILSKSFHGNGIGKLMWNKICKLAKQDNIKKLRINTDESSNYNFYVKRQYKKIFETKVTNGEKITAEKCYVFEVDL